jgi:urea transport system ATP-binding protein
MLAVNGLNQFYGESHTLWDVDLDVPEGQCVCVMGRNGVGKTTLLKSIMGLLPSASGSVKLGATSLAGLRAEDRVRAGIAYVPQGREIFGQLTVEDNLRVGLAARGGDQTIPEKIFRWFPVLKTMLNRRGGDLSGGQQQQLAFGRALATQPKVILLDEPTEGIQPSIVHSLGVGLEAIAREEGMALLLVEQNLELVFALTTRVAFIENGRIAAQSPTVALCDDSALLERYLSV